MMNTITHQDHFRRDWRRTFRNLWRWSRWKWFLLLWSLFFLALAGLYQFQFGAVTQVFPELGASFSYPYGSTVESRGMRNGSFRIAFQDAPKETQKGGGLVCSNLLTFFSRVWPSLETFPIFKDTTLGQPTHIHLVVRGKTGGEKFELKLRNASGEGWCVIGNEDYPVTREFRELVIPIEEFSSIQRTSMGRSFDAHDGLDAFIFGMGSQLDTRVPSEIYVASLRLSNNVRRDWIVGVSFFGIVFVVSYWLHLCNIWKTHFCAFISYQHNDEALAARIGTALQHRGIVVWFDKKDLSLGQDFSLEIARAIRTYRFFVLFASHHSSASQFVGVEMGLRLRRPVVRLLGIELGVRSAEISTGKILVIGQSDGAEWVPGILRNLHHGVLPSTVKDQELIVDDVEVERIADHIATIIYEDR